MLTEDMKRTREGKREAEANFICGQARRSRGYYETGH